MSDKDESQLPYVSVVVPAYNEEVNIARTLQDIKRQDYKGKLQIVVSDNNSTDKTVDIAKTFGVKLVEEKRKGTRFNYDTGMRAADGDIIILTNADVILPRDWVSAIVEVYQKHPDVVGVGTWCKFHSVPWYVNFTLRSLDWLNPIKTMWGPSLSCRRAAFYEVGGMDHGASLNEDAVFTLKLKKLGKVKMIRQPIVLMDGRRFNQGFIEAAKEWWRGYGMNSNKVLLRYVATGKAKSNKDSFANIRQDKNGNSVEID